MDNTYYTTGMKTPLSTIEKTRVLYVVESFSTGVYAIVRDIACNLNPDRFTVLILHSLRNDSPKNYEKDFQSSHVTLQYVPMGSFKDYVTATKIIRKTIKTFKPHTLHLHSSKAGLLGRIAAKFSPCKHILYSPHGFSFIRTDVSNFSRKIFFMLEYGINKFNKSKLIAVSEGELVHAHKITSNAIVINNFINLQDFNQRVETTKPYVVTSGRITAARNPHLFNLIAEQLLELQFIWVGDGPQREILTAPNITITGLLSRSEAIAYVQKFDIYIQTSLWEGMPVSILEAMASGKPVVATDIIGNRDLITHNKTGFLCNLDDPNQFIQLIKELHEDKELRLKIGQAAHTYIKNNHDKQQAIARYEKEYSQNNSSILEKKNEH